MEEYNECFEPHSWPAIGSKFIAIITPQGRLILESKPYLSLIRLIEYIGIETVSSFDLKGKDEMPLVSKTRLTLRDYQPASNGWFIYTTMNTKDKIKLIEKLGSLIGQQFICATKLA